MTAAFVEGLGFGLATTFLIGPVFFTLLQAALDHGLRGGVAVASGIITSDLLVVVLCLAFSVERIQEHVGGTWMALLGGLLLAGLSAALLLRLRPGGDPKPLGRRGIVGLFTAGFLVNFVNPVVFAIWIGLSLHAAGRYDENGVRALLGGALLGIFTTDLAKAYFAPKLRAVLTPRILRILNIVIGIALLVFSIRMFLLAARVEM